MAVNPDDAYDVVGINGASASTQISGLPFSGPIGGVRVALIPTATGGQWVAFPTFSQLEEAVFSMVVAGRIVEDDVAIMMVEAEATDNAWTLIKEQGPHRRGRGRGPRGLQGLHPLAVRGAAGARRPGRQARA
jgi:polyribonucleotide nucleotidyltransferase